MPDAWVIILKGITPKQVGAGINNIHRHWGTAFPPNGKQFRDLCLGMHTDAKGVQTRLEGSKVDPVNDPSHPNYQEPKNTKLLESDEYKARNQAAADKVLGVCKKMFPKTEKELPNEDCAHCQKPDASKHVYWGCFCDLICASEFQNKKRENK